MENNQQQLPTGGLNAPNLAPRVGQQGSAFSQYKPLQKSNNTSGLSLNGTTMIPPSSEPFAGLSAI
jgi:hypothetical protein